ncbi:MAG: hypothetical protein ACTHU0_00320, partial [Kofleriaceae bacterium]
MIGFGREVCDGAIGRGIGEVGGRIERIALVTVGPAPSGGRGGGATGGRGGAPGTGGGAIRAVGCPDVGGGGGVMRPVAGPDEGGGGGVMRPVAGPGVDGGVTRPVAGPTDGIPPVDRVAPGSPGTAPAPEAAETRSIGCVGPVATAIILELGRSLAELV